MVDKGTLPGASAEVRHREARWAAQAGQADTTTGRERAPDDHFRGASITKTFIATVLLHLEAKGKLSLDDSVGVTARAGAGRRVRRRGDHGAAVAEPHQRDRQSHRRPGVHPPDHRAGVRRDRAEHDLAGGGG
ncbi:serine hydrolase [Streptomyces koyangensis]|uniref:serine hydrolase n=1 Tax=Streptomyces koyangensis TaxID=188770 RepID=UPI003C2E91CD